MLTLQARKQCLPEVYGLHCIQISLILLLYSLALYSENLYSVFSIPYLLHNFPEHLLMSFALCYVLIKCFMFVHLFVVCLFVLYVLFSVVCVLCLCIVSPHVHSCLFSFCVQFYPHCHRGETQLQYHILYIIHYSIQ